MKEGLQGGGDVDWTVGLDEDRQMPRKPARRRIHSKRMDGETVFLQVTRRPVGPDWEQGTRCNHRWALKHLRSPVMSLDRPMERRLGEVRVETRRLRRARDRRKRRGGREPDEEGKREWTGQRMN